jgi:TPR repeat protein
MTVMRIAGVKSTKESRISLGTTLAEHHEKQPIESTSATSTLSAAAPYELLQAYHATAKKTNDQQLQLEFCTFLFDYADHVTDDVSRLQYKREAMEWLRKIAFTTPKKETDLVAQAEAQYQLAELLRSGELGHCDLSQAYQLYESSAKKGHILSSYKAGLCCEEGIGRKKNLVKAALYYRKGAGFNHYASIFKLVNLYVYSDKVFPRGGYEAYKWLKIAITHILNDPLEKDLYALACLHELGVWYADGAPVQDVISDFRPDAEYAIELIYEAGRRGYAPAQFKLGEMFEEGLYQVKVDLRSAQFWFKKVQDNTLTNEEEFIYLPDWHAIATERLRGIEAELRFEEIREKRRKERLAAEGKLDVVQDSGLETELKQKLKISTGSAIKNVVNYIVSAFSPRKTVLPPFLEESEDDHPELNDNAMRILNILKSRKKLKRDKVPAPINTKTQLKKRRSTKAAAMKPQELSVTSSVL